MRSSAFRRPFALYAGEGVFVGKTDNVLNELRRQLTKYIKRNWMQPIERTSRPFTQARGKK